MASLKARTSQAAALHRRVVATVTAASTVLDATRPAPADQRAQHSLAERLRAAAEELVPGWLGAPLDAQSEDAPLGGPHLPGYVRIGIAQPLDDARFPAVVPLLGTGHLTVDADARDPRVAGLLRSLLLRLLAAAPPGALLVRGVDAAAPGEVFAPFAPLADAGLMPPPATDRTGLRAVLAEAEQWIRPARPTTARHYRRDRTLLLVIASLPELTEAVDLTRIGALAEHGPEAGLHLVVAGWPPPPLTAETTQPPLPRTTMIALRNPYALVGDPPGTSFATPVPHLPGTGLNSPVFLDEDPPARLVERVCQKLAARFDAGSCLGLGDLLPDETEQLWSEESTAGLRTTVGSDGGRVVSLGFDDLTPHWIVRGRPGSGRSSFLVNVLYGLCGRYSPEELALYLVDFSPGATYAEFVPTGRDPSWLPHVRAAGMEADPEYGLAVLRELTAEVERRARDCAEAGVTRFSELPAGRRPPRVVCLLDEFPLLLAGDAPAADEGLALLESLARTGRSYGVHLILATRTAPGLQARAGGVDGILGQFPVRVALPGGSDALEPSNDAAAGLPLGTAVVNTAGGLGGPRGATRGHERTVRFPAPQHEPAVLAALRQRLWERRAPDAVPPPVFAGYARPRLDDDPAYRAALAATEPPPAPAPAPRGGARADRGTASTSSGAAETPRALLGRAVDVPGATVGVSFDPAPEHQLAVVGPDPAGADLLGSAARSLAAGHPPGSARFVLASLAPDPDRTVPRLAAELAERHPVETVDAAGLARALDPGAAGDPDQPGYLVVFGLDGLDPETVPADRLRTLLTEGPGRGAHLLSWWRRPDRFARALGGATADRGTQGAAHTQDAGHARDGSASPGSAGGYGGSLVLLDRPDPGVVALLGHPVEWRPRPHRALLYDGATGRTTLFIPFVRPGDPPEALEAP
ncbi:FtsK/SpoIIIE domain-containing protein [Micromonospora sp. NPDC049559]|uniref:FtsK/SpoIIIE domain-containing protein n=1 Tax=Micromonospora sp. NPDC049559 TaxID=3155923 RepID=UPI00342D98D3